MEQRLTPHLAAIPAPVSLVPPPSGPSIAGGSPLASVPGYDLSALPAQPPLLQPLPPADEELAVLGRFYASRGWAPLWTEGDGARASSVIARLARAREDGLPPEAYQVARLRELQARDDAPSRASLELEVGRNLLRFARDLTDGRLAATDGFDVPRAEPSFVPEALLAAAAESARLADLLDRLGPQDTAYVMLRRELAFLREQATLGGWSTVPASAEALRPGAVASAVTALRRRLRESGDLGRSAAGASSPAKVVAAPLGPVEAGEGGGRRYDPALAQAVQAFQGRHGLPADGVVGAMTLQALNVPITSRIEQVVVNLERQRRMLADLGPRHIVVNVPDYFLQYVEAGAGVGGAPRIYESRVVVGTVDDQTPTFSAPMTYIEMNPNWNVPRSIATREFLPKLRRDPTYLARNDYQLLSGGQPVDATGIDWSSVTSGSFPYRIRQRPGSRNALGQVKFMFPNPHNVYIHDTPSKKLFGQVQRSFSHGCIRLSDPFSLASLLIGPQGWDEARFDAVLASGKTRTVSLQEPVPVHIVYRTAWVDPAGIAQFRADLYGRDGERAKAIAMAPERPFKEPAPPMSRLLPAPEAMIPAGTPAPPSATQPIPLAPDMPIEGRLDTLPPSTGG